MSTSENQTLEPAAAPTTVHRRILSLPVHQWLESAQQSHGIPHNDYSQYHSYCTRRLSRLRHAKEVRKDLVHSSTYVSGSGGGGGGGKQTRRHAYVPRNIVPALPTDTTTSEGEEEEEEIAVPTTTTTATSAAAPATAKELHENILWVLLVGAERAWAHAGELRARYTEGNTANHSNAFSSLTSSKSKRSPGQLRHHSLRRLKRAQQLAQQLEQVALQFSQEEHEKKDNVTVVVDPRTVQECQAYSSWMSANWALEMADWKTACEEYRSAITICRKLSQLAAEEAVVASNEEKNDNDDEEAGGTNVAESLELRDLFTTRADNMLPLLKYCQYEWREANGGTLPDSWEDPEATVAATATKDLGGGSTISFRGQDIPIENKNLRVLLLKADGLLQQQQQQDPSATTSMDQDGKFATLLSTYDDAMSLVTQELKSYEGAKAGPAVNAKRRELELLSGYIQYEKLAATCRRLEALLPTLTEDAEIVHVYDALLQNARDILSLPSSSGKKDAEQDEDEFWLQANANVLRIRAFRCYYLAKLYASGQQYGQAKALLKQSQLLSTRALEEIAACDEDMEHGEEYTSSLQRLQQNDLVAISCRVQAQAFLSSQQGASRSFYNYKSAGGTAGAAAAGGTNRSLLVRLSDFDPGQASRQLADVPPDVLPLPCKPTFYDVAWNYASQFPDLDAVLDKRKPKTSSSGGGGGLFGWLRGGK